MGKDGAAPIWFAEAFDPLEGVHRRVVVRAFDPEKRWKTPLGEEGDCVVYILADRTMAVVGYSVYTGHTNNPVRRAREHILKGRPFHVLLVISERMSRLAAMRLELELMQERGATRRTGRPRTILNRGHIQRLRESIAKEEARRTELALHDPAAPSYSKRPRTVERGRCLEVNEPRR